MSNMSYCRFENTASDLGDCCEHILDKLTGDYEPPARVSLIKYCVSILEALDFEIWTDEGAVVTKVQIEAQIAKFEKKEEEEEG